MTNLHDDERPFAHPDMPEGMTQEEYAEWLHRHRDEPGWEQVEAEVTPNLATVVSVQLKRSELTAIANAAEAAGLKLSSFIRQAALGVKHGEPGGRPAGSGPATATGRPARRSPWPR